MSNRLTIEPTKFVDSRTGEESFGVRVYDDYAQAYVNNWESIPELDLPLLKKVLTIKAFKDNNEIVAMLNHVYESKKGLYIGPTWYKWDDIKSLFRGWK